MAEPEKKTFAEEGEPEGGQIAGSASFDDTMQDQADESDATTSEEGEDLAARLAMLEAERDDMKDRMLRALADAENTRRRADRDRSDANRYGGVRLARDLLAVHDNLKRALSAADESTRASAGDLLEGVELTQRELLNVFAKHKISVVSPAKGERFDVNLHQAMFEAPIAGAEDGTIIEVMQDGFVFDDRLLRAAMVGVAKGGGPAPKPAENRAPDINPSDDS